MTKPLDNLKPPAMEIRDRIWMEHLERELNPLLANALFGKTEIGALDDYVVTFLEEHHSAHAERERYHKRSLNVWHQISVILENERNRLKLSRERFHADGHFDKKHTKILADFSRKKMWPRWPCGSESNALGNGPSTATSELLHQMLEIALTTNQPHILDNLAKAVRKIYGDRKRIKGRISGDGPTFKIEPYDPVVLLGLKLKAGGKPISTKLLFKDAIKQTTGLLIGDKKAQRTLRRLGVPPSKGGRPRKHRPKNK
jgi:hypothetical protein